MWSLLNYCCLILQIFEGLFIIKLYILQIFLVILDYVDVFTLDCVSFKTSQQ